MTTILRYRITSSGGILYLRELVHGQIVARIESNKVTFSDDDVPEIVVMFAAYYEGRITNIRHEIDTVYIECRIN